jgi:hypothetical protein
MDTLLKSGRDLTPINMKSVKGVRSFPLLRVDKKQSGNLGSVKWRSILRQNLKSS